VADGAGDLERAVATAERGRKLYEGKWKILYETGDPTCLVQWFRDAPRSPRPGSVRLPRRGILKNRIAAHLFEVLHAGGIPTHFVRIVGPRQMLIRRLEMLRLEVVVRNTVAGSLARRLGMEVGSPLPAPVVEFYYKSDALGDPLLNESHVCALGLASLAELRAAQGTALRANRVLLPFFAEREILLVDFKLEFGRQAGQLMIGDELSPDGCRFWDRTTRERLGKDRGRRNPVREAAAYREICERICT
jgi:phosphoribosylaminoimidazole-succinocarboxamide synthase